MRKSELSLRRLRDVNTTCPSDSSINSTELFLLHSGVKVEIIDEIGEWINIKTSNGNKGWIKENKCKLL